MRILFMGTPDFAVPVLQTLIASTYEVAGVVTQPDRPKGRKKKLTPPPVKVEAEANDLPVFQPESLKEKESYEPILNMKPDLVVTCAYGQILPKQIIEAPPLGCMNVHASLLPKHRGGAPIHRAIINGDTETGVTLMYMVEALDAGDIIAKTSVAIEESDHVGSLHDKLSKAGAKLLAEWLPAIEEDRLEPLPQQEEEVTFSPTIKRGEEKINWNHSARAIFNHVRGMNPWPVTYTSFRGESLKVWEVRPAEGTFTGAPGEVLEAEREKLLVKTGGDGAVYLLEVQPSGKKRMPAASFLNGLQQEISPGERLGDE
ncbi:methionyl-tRNA formyltransferase [Salsuginibacillus kocurii]|uniref:methionyl-tRNA formyltransferase n=1 Tax=Salsuginibacillus kocurii TaxID=427078 RepID=UPI00036D0CED